VTEAYRKKLIEVALPLAEINAASAREKSIRHGHPSTLHLWWARRPLAACRAVLFGQLVDDPSAVPEEFPTEADQVRERDRLFEIIKQLVLWENSNNQTVLDAAKQEIARSVARDKGVPAPTSPQAVQQFLIEHAPPVLDPFCGGGSIPLEAQRLGLRAYGSDLNPVAVLITKALIEIPPKFAGQPPVNPEDRTKMGSSVAWPGATGLAADVRYYGRWMRDEAQRRIGHLYPKVQLPGGQGEATVIAWLWARTVRCPNLCLRHPDAAGTLFRPLHETGQGRLGRAAGGPGGEDSAVSSADRKWEGARGHGEPARRSLPGLQHAGRPRMDTSRGQGRTN